MSKDVLNPVLFDIAAWKLRGEREKSAFVPAGGDPSQGGGDPSQGGAPDPSQAGMAGPPPGMVPPSAATPPAAAAAQPAPGGPLSPQQPGVPGAGGSKKLDINFVYLELGRIRKLVTHLMKSTGVDLPPDILDDTTVAQNMQGQPPQSPPIGQDASAQQQPGLPAMGGQGGISPIQAPDAGGATKQSSVASLFQGPVDSDFGTMTRRMDALAALSRSLGRL